MCGLVYVAVNIFVCVATHGSCFGQGGGGGQGCMYVHVHVLYMLSLAVPIYVLGVLPINSAPHSP